MVPKSERSISKVFAVCLALIGPISFLRAQQAFPFLPFSADYRITDNVHLLDPDKHPEPRVVEGRVYRDRHGCERHEDRMLVGPRGRVARKEVFITDQVAGFEFELRKDSKLAIRRAVVFPVGKWQRPPPPSEIPDPPPGFKPVEDLGTREIEGLECKGSRSYRHNAEGYTETWWAPSVGYVTRMTTVWPEGELTHERWFNFQVGTDPDPSLFKVPSDYKVVDWSPKYSPRVAQ